MADPVTDADLIELGRALLAALEGADPTMYVRLWGNEMLTLDGDLGITPRVAQIARERGVPNAP